MIALPQPKTFSDYQDLARETDRKAGSEKPSFALIGLFGEVGGVLAEVKKLQRDKLIHAQHRRVVIEEMGDVLWYLSTTASRSGVSLDTVARIVARTRARSVTERARPVHFADFDQAPNVVEIPETEEYRRRLQDFGAAAGQLLADRERRFRWRGLADLMAQVLNHLIVLAHASDIKMEEVAAFNIEKTYSRWPPEQYRTFDLEFETPELPEFERIPRHLEIEISENWNADRTKSFVVQRYNKINVGDRLTDNITEQDDYRFHDVFHYAFAAVLHWSPVLRALFKTKRKSVAATDENEDGARATLIEEGISTFVFNAAKPYDYFRRTKQGELSYDLLKTIQQLVKGYEVERCPPWLWEEAILQGFAAFRYLQDKRDGTILMDLDNRSLTIRSRNP